VTFEFYDKLKPIVVGFDQAQAGADGGVVLHIVGAVNQVLDRLEDHMETPVI
jgi:hypothetical protein